MRRSHLPACAVVIAVAVSASLRAGQPETFDADGATARLATVRQQAAEVTASLGVEADVVADILGQANACVVDLERRSWPSDQKRALESSSRGFRPSRSS